jgi:phage terminase large subunit-like protein
MCEWEPGQKSPDRMDAMVWAFWELFRLGEKDEQQQQVYVINDDTEI